MIKSYFIIAYRNLLKNKFLAFANIGILALVIAAVLHLFRYVSFEKSFDRFHENYEEIYRVNTRLTGPDGYTDYATSHGLTGNLMQRKFSAVENSVTLTPLHNDCTIVYEDVVFREDRVYEVDSTFFTLFSFPLLAGEPSKVLSRPNTVVLTESMAKKYFKEENPIGKTVKIKGKFETFDFEITGICKDFPPNSHIQMNWICSNHHLFEVPDKYYNFERAMNHWTYIRLSDQEQIENIVEQTNTELAQQKLFDFTTVKVNLTPITNIHLQPSLAGDFSVSTGGFYETILLVVLVGAICFFITYLNFINISLVKTMDRTKEVGIRKVLGANLKDNLMLFFVESLVQIIIALFLGFDLFFATMATVSDYFQFPAAFYIENEVLLYLLFTGGFLFLSMLISFIYALIFSKIKPLHALKVRNKVLSKKITSKTIPIIVQFTICVLFLSFTFLVFKQVRFIRDKDLGFEKDNLIVIWTPHMEEWWHMNSKMKAFDREAKTHASVVDVTRAIANPGGYGYGMKGRVSNKKTGIDNHQQITYNRVMYNWFDVFDMKLLAGNYYAESSEESDIIINYSACKKLGYPNPADIIGTEILVEDQQPHKRVIGVTADHNFKSLKFNTEPVVFLLLKEDMRNPTVAKLMPEQYKEGIKNLEASWKKVFPENEFVYSIFSERIDRYYENETRFQKWLNLFCLLTLVVSSFGIFIITHYTFKERGKEIAIHKVLGASIFDIMNLSKNFIWLMVLSIVLGLSISFFLAREWLQNYAYRITIGIWFLIIPILIVGFFFLITLFYSVNKAVLNDPVKALRSE